MRRRTLALQLAAVLLAVPLVAAPASAKPVSKAHGTASSGAETVTFSVKNPAAPHGSFTVTNRDRSLTADVVCYVQQDGRALLAGRITDYVDVKGNPQTQGEYLLYVEDNGQGRKAAPDRFFHSFTEIHPFFGCPSTITGTFPSLAVDSGNIKLHK